MLGVPRVSVYLLDSTGDRVIRFGGRQLHTA